MNTATIYHPTIISIPASPYCELVRWALDHWRIVYDERCHTPVTRSLSEEPNGSSAVPVLDTGETSLESARDVLDYYEARSPLNRKLYPEESTARSEAEKLFNYFLDTLGVATRAWTYSYLLPIPDVVVPLWTERAPWWERVALQVFYASISRKVSQSIRLEPNSIAGLQAAIDAVFADAEARLADGRRYLMGDEFTAADLGFAAMAAPVLLPAEFAGPLPALKDLPPPMQAAVERWRTRPAGQFVLRLYKEERPQRVADLVAMGKHGSGRTIKDRLANLLIRTCILRPVFGFLRKHVPIAMVGKHAIVSRHDDAVEVLTRDGDFTLSQVNAPKINEIDGPFILGMDRSPQYDRENAILHQAVKREDLEAIRAFVAQTAVELIEAARPRRRIDVVGGLARVVAVRLVASYFGIPGPDEPTMMRWMRDIFHYIFADLTNDRSVERDALNSAKELRGHMDEQIALRKVALSKPRLNDDVLTRLVALEGAQNSWLDDHAVRRNLAGVIVGAVDTTSKFVTLAIDELLRRPAALAKASEAAAAGDVETVRRFAWEAIRFNPHHPLLVRYCARETRIAAGQPRSKAIPAGTFVYVVTFSAMFDSEAFRNPDEFDATRTNEYLHFGYNLHACFGRLINAVQIPELVAALLRLRNLRRTPGNAGRILYEGPFPDRLVLEFDA